MQRYTVAPHPNAGNKTWLVQEVVVIGGDHAPHVTAVCGSEDDARLIAIALEEYWDRRARRTEREP